MTSQTEKRLCRTRNTCPKFLEDKLHRAMDSKQTMTIQKNPQPLSSSHLRQVLADKCHPCKDSELALDFSIAGSTGNLYKVTLDYNPKCSCPDFRKRQDVCKHIMYILVKVVGLPQTSKSVYQKALLSTELAEIHSSLAKHRPKSTYCSSAGQSKTSTKKTHPKCDECHGSIKNGNQPVICPSCDSFYHEFCLGILPSIDRLSLSGSNRKPKIKTTEVECPQCGACFHHDEGYENIAHETGQSRLRDHSTYRPTPGYPGWKHY